MNSLLVTNKKLSVTNNFWKKPGNAVTPGLVLGIVSISTFMHLGISSNVSDKLDQHPQNMFILKNK